MNATVTMMNTFDSESESFPDQLTRNEIQLELDRILSSPRFRRAKRMSRFLRVLVEQALRHADPLNAKRIAALVFDKPQLDSRTDPIVRVEARRLRTLLSAYYKNEGANDPVAVLLPSQGYQPQFAARPVQRMSVYRKDDDRRSLKSIAVLPFLNMTNDPGQEVFCDSITEELINVLTRVDGLQVASQTSVFQYKDPCDIREIGKDLGVSAVLEGSVRMIEERVRVTAQLSSAADGFHLCSETFDVKFERNFALQEKLATAIATMTQRFVDN